MKLIYTSILISSICIYSVACSKSPTTVVTVVEEVTLPTIELTKVNETAVMIEEIAIPKLPQPIDPVISGPKIKTVCRDALDSARKPIKNSDGTIKQVCVTTKVRKKYQGTPVPNQKN
jgi:hypothetical protein